MGRGSPIDYEDATTSTEVPGAGSGRREVACTLQSGVGRREGECDLNWEPLAPWKTHSSIINPSCHGPFFPRHVTASGHIEPGSSGHMRPGRDMAYPFSPPPTVVVTGPLSQSLIFFWHDKFQYCFCCLPSWQLYIGTYLLFLMC
jgi:hypothetical protein